MGAGSEDALEMLARVFFGLAAALTACDKLPIAQSEAPRVFAYPSVKYVVPRAYTRSSGVPLLVWVNYPTFKPSAIPNCMFLMVVPRCSDFYFAVWGGGPGGA